MGLTIITPPAQEPVTLDEIKQYLRLDLENEFDALLTALLVAARTYCETFQNRAYFTQTLEYTMDKWSFPVWLPRAPLQTVLSVNYYDLAGNEFGIYDYLTDANADRGRVAMHPDSVKPSERLRPMNAVKIRYIAGYSSVLDVPETVKLAIKLFVGHRFENPEAEGVPKAVHDLLWPQRVVPV